ncbi:hypothetical protein QTI33_34290 [Variovorax sp. J22P271]|uniref:hypothetical protein n=1 Tax=Variovorax davisae TaxID=3053515 RepID=UPI0025775191|nr:hypothetical protein [Variovorax sp. J22P271]MDM0037240.1 hypothetical protein [Variovorax sp. J22P271]
MAKRQKVKRIIRITIGQSNEMSFPKGCRGAEVARNSPTHGSRFEPALSAERPAGGTHCDAEHGTDAGQPIVTGVAADFLDWASAPEPSMRFQRCFARSNGHCRRKLRNDKGSRTMRDLR